MQRSFVRRVLGSLSATVLSATVLSATVPLASAQATALTPSGAPAIWGATTARAVPGGINVTMELINTGSTRLLTLPRSGAQNCEATLHLRVLRVGTREQVYPRGEERLCTQDIVNLTVPSSPLTQSPRGQIVDAERTLRLNRQLKLDPGMYLVEAWVPAGGKEPRIRGTYAIVRVP